MSSGIYEYYISYHSCHLVGVQLRSLSSLLLDNQSQKTFCDPLMYIGKTLQSLKRVSWIFVHSRDHLDLIRLQLVTIEANSDGLIPLWSIPKSKLVPRILPLNSYENN